MRFKDGEIALFGKMNEEMLVLYCILEHEFDCVIFVIFGVVLRCRT